MTLSKLGYIIELFLAILIVGAVLLHFSSGGQHEGAWKHPARGQPAGG